MRSRTARGGAHEYAVARRPCLSLPVCACVVLSVACPSRPSRPRAPLPRFRSAAAGALRCTLSRVALQREQKEKEKRRAQKHKKKESRYRTATTHGCVGPRACRSPLLAPRLSLSPPFFFLSSRLCGLRVWRRPSSFVPTCLPPSPLPSFPPLPLLLLRLCLGALPGVCICACVSGCVPSCCLV